MKRYKFLVLLLAMVVLTAVLVGCGNDERDDLGNESTGSVSVPESRPDELIVGRWGARYGSLNDEYMRLNEDSTYLKAYGDGTLLLVVGRDAYNGTWEKATAELPDDCLWGGVIDVSGMEGVVLISVPDSEENATYKLGCLLGDDMYFYMFR